MALTGMKMEMPAVFKRYGPELGRRFWAWSSASIDHLACTLAEEQIDRDFERSGHILLAAKPKHYTAMAHELEWMRSELGYEDAWLVSKDQQQAEIGTAAFFGGLADQRSGALHPAKYVFGLPRRRPVGGRCSWSAQVTGVARRQGGFSVGTSRGMVESKELLIATNGYTSNVVPALRNGIFPIGSYIIVTEPLPAALQAEISPRRRMFFDKVRTFNYRLTPDGRMLFMAGTTCPQVSIWSRARMMRQRMVELFPQLAGAIVTHTWTGKLGVTFDLMPHAGRAEGIHYAYGHAGHGVSIAGYLGKK